MIFLLIIFVSFTGGKVHQDYGRFGKVQREDDTQIRITFLWNME